MKKSTYFQYRCNEYKIWAEITKGYIDNSETIGVHRDGDKWVSILIATGHKLKYGETRKQALEHAQELLVTDTNIKEKIKEILNSFEHRMFLLSIRAQINFDNLSSIRTKMTPDILYPNP